MGMNEVELYAGRSKASSYSAITNACALVSVNDDLPVQSAVKTHFSSSIRFFSSASLSKSFLVFFVIP